MLTTTGQHCTVFRDVRLTRSALESAGELCRLASPLSALHPLRLNRAELLRAHSGAVLRCGVRRRAGRDRRRRRRRLPMAFLLKSLFRGTQPAPADADAYDEALKTELAPEVRVVSAGEAEAAEYAPRSTSGSSQDLASVKGSLVPRQQSEAAALAAEIAQLSHAPPPRGAPLGCPCAAPARSKLRTALCRALCRALCMAHRFRKPEAAARFPRHRHGESKRRAQAGLGLAGRVLRRVHHASHAAGPRLLRHRLRAS